MALQPSAFTVHLIMLPPNLAADLLRFFRVFFLLPPNNLVLVFTRVLLVSLNYLYVSVSLLVKGNYLFSYLTILTTYHMQSNMTLNKPPASLGNWRVLSQTHLGATSQGLELLHQVYLR